MRIVKFEISFFKLRFRIEYIVFGRNINAKNILQLCNYHTKITFILIRNLPDAAFRG